MDVSTSSAAALTRPRLAIQLITGLAAAFIVYQAWLQSRDNQSTTSRSRRGSSSAGASNGTGLHRSNAVRRSERSTRRQIEGALDDIELEHGAESRQQLEAILERHFGRHEAPPPTITAPHDAAGPAPFDPTLQSDENAHAPASGQASAPAQGEIEAETVAGEDPPMEDDWQDAWGPLPPPPRSGQNIVGLLFRVSEDNARRNAYVHRGCMCNACGLLPIRGIRYRCANCADFDLCETCESQGLHIKTHVFYKVKIPAPPFGPKSMQPVWYPGDPDTAMRNLPSSLIRHLARETGFERPELEALWEQWTFIANTEWRDDPDELYLAADRKTFERYLVPSSGMKWIKPNLIHDRMFAFYDTNGDDLISFPEFLKGLSYKKGKDRLERIFKGYDIDGDGYISRKDCLRIFRTYYVLYKQMHGDVLEGLDQQAMNNTDTQQLVTSRQPLSSYFGREGRVPEADHGRPMEGKVFHSSGDVYINDDKDGVVNETRPDVGDRQEILSSLLNHGDSEYGNRFYTSASEHVTSPSGDEVQHIYHEALLNPPQRVEELVSLLVGEPRNIQPSELDPGNPEDEEENNDGEAIEEDTSVEEEEIEGTRPSIESGSAQRPVPSSIHITADRITYRNLTSTPPAAIMREAADERWTNRPPTESQLRAQHLRMEAHRKRAMDRKLRVTVRKKLFDRWKKRNFYLAEEEGATPPEGFDQEDDVLADTNGAEGAASKEAQPPLSARSRSSSKVRFAEDTDDYEIRSNPSTSSRSVPERWGGMEIPDAERDMGKEILYVVTQQAFNEILDLLFTEKEDLAVKAAQTKEFREAFRDMLDSFDPDQPQQAQQAQSQQSEPQQPARSLVVAGVDENKPAQQKTLSELLAISGYTIDESLAVNGVGAQQDESEESDGSDQEDEEDADDPEEDSQTAAEKIVYRDPTMPQFRPNSEADLVLSAPSPSENGGLTSRAAGKRPRPVKLNSLGEAATSSNDKPVNPPSTLSPKRQQRPPRHALVEWKKLDAAEKEAKERGGWGRLNVQEFRDIWHREENGPHRLDYLGTWIDFCIP